MYTNYAHLCIFMHIFPFLPAASNFIPESDGPSAYPSAKACAVLAESEDEGQDISTSSQQQLSVSSMGTQLPRNLPPDGTSFRQIALGKSLNQAIPAYGYWNIQFYQSEASYVNMDLSVPRGASVGLYARRNGLPTHTNYDIMEVIKGFEDSRSRRSSRVSPVSFFPFVWVLTWLPSPVVFFLFLIFPLISPALSVQIIASFPHRGPLVHFLLQ